MNRLRLKSEGGFTLIELLVVIAIIGMLAAIAMPQFSAYRKRVYASTIKTDLKNAATAQEAYLVISNTYLSGALSTGTPAGYFQSDDITMTSAAGQNTFFLTATHTKCTGVNWTYSSVTGLAPGPIGGCP